MTTRDTFSAHGSDAWIAMHRRELRRHVAQCWTRRAWRSAAQGLDAAHRLLGPRFATVVLAVTGLMLLPALWT
ncbi:hypothetical protein [Piscinibacter sp.]|uniref:hypothetical protein n=1 Tax=Piscinibacter sp. TaxID=1903157 RepID=UPI0039E3296D